MYLLQEKTSVISIEEQFNCVCLPVDERDAGISYSRKNYFFFFLYSFLYTKSSFLSVS